jgi:Asp-tRNA(Asn)/Glu-tRNA(Gln) amidotransferase C subunit
MRGNITPESVQAAAQMIELPLNAEEVGPVLERLQSLVDSVDQIARLIDDTADVDARFDARWEVDQV